MKLLVVSWGNFGRWVETTYRFGDEISVGPSTLPILQKVIKPDWTVIILSDTLGTDFSSYEALQKNVRGRVMDFLERIGAGREVDVIIAPGVGQFSHGTFRGNAMDAYYVILHRLAQIIPANENLEVHFDSTHGLNYVTLLAYRALKDLLGIAAVGNDVHFRAYNSDPLVRGVSKELTINTIEDVKVEPSPLKTPLPREEYIGNFRMDGKTFGEVLRGLDSLKRLKDLRGGLNAWISSVINGLPLVFTSTYPDGGVRKTLEETVEQLVGVYHSWHDTEGNTLIRRLSLEPGFGVLVGLLFQLKVLEMDGLPDVEPSVKKLKEISERVFRGRVLASTKTELHRLASSVGEDTNGWIPYAELLRKGGKSPSPQVNERNFLAHAGLEANLIEVRRDGELYVRYRAGKVRYGGAQWEARKVMEKIAGESIGG